MSSPETLLDRIRKLDKLSASEAKIAELFEESYPLTALETVTSISAKSCVGKATVVRFISRLGFKNFKEFNEQLKEELTVRLESPYTRFSKNKSDSAVDKDDLLGRFIEHARKDMEEAHARIDPEHILAAGKIMASCQGVLYLAGQGESYSLAHLFCNQLLYLRENVTFLQGLVSNLPHKLIDVTPNDVLFAIARQRYGYQTYRTCKWFSRRGATVILLTDKEVSPSSEVADIQLVARSQGPGMFANNLSRLAVLETLTWLMSSLLEGSLIERSEICEKLFEDFDVFMPWAYQHR